VPESPVVTRLVTEGTVRLEWSPDHGLDEVHRAVVDALAAHHRVEAWVAVDDPPDRHRCALWSGMRREGVMRGVTVDGQVHDVVVYARLVDDSPAHEPEGFRALLNSFLPRKRAIGQMLVRDRDRRILLCQLTYKTDWDLPGGVVEVGESPQLAVSREVEEELGLTIPAGRLLLTDWLPPWSGWDDALTLVFDGGDHDAEMLDRVVRQTREIKDVAFCTLEEVAARCADITTRRVASAVANLDHGAPAYVEGGGSGA
jgi:8-oxo-dGTP pyrophosphatase MutT (NUDIX family)